MASKTALTIIVSIILTVILISIVNVGTSILLEKPEYEDYCSVDIVKVLPSNATDFEMEEYNKRQRECHEEYENAQKPYNQYRYYIFAGIGFILLLVGLFAKENMIQLIGLAAGGILVAEGIVTNWQNKIIVFFSLLAILIIFGFVAWKVIKQKS